MARDVRVRPAEASDCRHFINIHCPEFKALPRHERVRRCGWWGDEDACSFLIRLYRGLGGEVYVAELYGEVVGDIELLPHKDCALGPRAYVNVLWVKADARRKGVGRALIEEAVRWAREAGFERLDTMPEESSEGFYERLGFRVVATQCKAERRLVRRGVVSEPKYCKPITADEAPREKLLVTGTYRPGLFSWFAAWLDTYTRPEAPSAYRVKQPLIREREWVALMDRFYKGRASLLTYTDIKPSNEEFTAMMTAATEIARAAGVEDLFIQTWSEYEEALRNAGFAILKTGIRWMSLRIR